MDDANCVTMADVETKFANLTRRQLSSGSVNYDPNDVNHDLERQRNLMEELRNVPSSLRVLEDQVGHVGF